MSGNTTYHGFNTYDRLEEWDYNPDFEKLDQRLELRGPSADRPASAPDGAKYSVTNSGDSDYGARYVYDGSSDSWVKQPLDTPTLKAPSSGPVEVPNSSLQLNGNDVSGVNFLDLADRQADGSFWRFAEAGSGQLNIDVGDNSSRTTYLAIYEGGPVEVKNGTLDVNDNDITNIRRIKAGGRDNPAFLTSGTGTGKWRFRDTANSLDILRINEGGPVEVRNANFDIGSNNLYMDGGDGTAWRLGDYGNGIQLTKSGSGQAEFAIDGKYILGAGNVDLTSHANEIVWNDADGDGNRPGIYVDSNGEVVARDDAGNTTVLT